MSIWFSKLIEKLDREAGWYVVGGEYTDTTFENLLDKTKAYINGPFKSYETAYDAWKSKAWETVDTCCERYTIIEKNINRIK